MFRCVSLQLNVLEASTPFSTLMLHSFRCFDERPTDVSCEIDEVKSALAEFPSPAESVGIRLTQLAKVSVAAAYTITDTNQAQSIVTNVVLGELCGSPSILRRNRWESVDSPAESDVSPAESVDTPAESVGNPSNLQRNPCESVDHRSWCGEVGIPHIWMRVWPYTTRLNAGEAVYHTS